MVRKSYRIQRLLLAAACAVPLCFSTAHAANILFVTGTTNPPADPDVHAALAGLGNTVTDIADNAGAVAMTAALPGKDLVVISSNVGSGNAVALFGGATAMRDTNVPIVVYEDFVFDDLQLTVTPEPSGGQGFTDGQLSFDMTALGSIHPLGAGLSGTQTVLTPTTPIGSAMPHGLGGWGAGVQLIATFDSAQRGETVSPRFIYEKGASLVDGTPAPQHRATLFIHDRNYPNLTVEGQMLFDATINYMTSYAWAAGSSSWGTNTNWAQFASTPAAAPSAAGAHVEFLAAGAPTITLDGDRTAETLHFANAAGYTIAQGSSGTLSLTDGTYVGHNHVGFITVDSGSNSITAPLSLPTRTIINTTAAGAAIALSGTMTVAPGSAIEKYGPGSLSLNADTGSTGVFNASLTASGTPSGGTVNFGSTQHLSGLSLTDTNAVITEGGARVVVTNALAMAGSSTINIKDNDMLVTTGSLSDVRTAVVTNKIFTNSTVTTVAGKATAVGYASGGDTAIAGLGGVFDGQPFTASSVLVKYAYVGDLNLDGSVDGSDISVWATHFTGFLGAGGTHTWTEGDWNYDGSVDGSDASAWATNFTGFLGGGGLGGGVSGAAAAPVPEPASLSLLMVGSLLALKRRRN